MKGLYILKMIYRIVGKMFEKIYTQSKTLITSMAMDKLTN